MAARENQGLQIALIIFVILTIILIVTTYMFFSSSQKEKEANKALASDNSNKDNQAREAARESEALKNTLGAPLAQLLLEYKTDEWARFNSAITDWERTMYWEDTP